MMINGTPCEIWNGENDSLRELKQLLLAISVSDRFGWMELGSKKGKILKAKKDKFINLKTLSYFCHLLRMKISK